MEEVSLIQVNREQLAELTEEKRVLNLLEENKGEPNEALLFDYYTKLMQKKERGKTTIRSVRLALRPAANYLSELGRKQREIKSLLMFI